MADPDDQPTPRTEAKGAAYWLAVARKSLGPRHGTARAQRPTPRGDQHEMAAFDVVYAPEPEPEDPEDDGTF